MQERLSPLALCGGTLLVVKLLKGLLDGGLDIGAPCPELILGDGDHRHEAIGPILQELKINRLPSLEAGRQRHTATGIGYEHHGGLHSQRLPLWGKRATLLPLQQSKIFTQDK